MRYIVIDDLNMIHKTGDLSDKEIRQIAKCDWTIIDVEKQLLLLYGAWMPIPDLSGEDCDD
jgi:hypothetical protein